MTAKRCISNLHNNVQAARHRAIRTQRPAIILICRAASATREHRPGIPREFQMIRSCRPGLTWRSWNRLGKLRLRRKVTVKDHMTKQTNNNGANLGFAAQFRAAANKLRGNMDSSDYRHVALELILLKHISDAFEAKRAGLPAGERADPEDSEEYFVENVLWGPKAARQHIFKVNPCNDVSGDLLFFLLKWLKPKFAEMARNKQTTCLGRVMAQDLSQTFVDVPSAEEQANVVGIIGPIQNKIDLNRRMNNTLKAIAQAISKDWFVEFGPTHPVEPAAPLRRCRAMAPGNVESATGMEKIGRFGNGGAVHRGRRPTTMHNCTFLPSRNQSSESSRTQVHGEEIPFVKAVA